MADTTPPKAESAYLNKPLRTIEEVEAAAAKAKAEATLGGMGDDFPYEDVDRVQKRDTYELLPKNIMVGCDTLANTGRLDDLREVHAYIEAIFEMKEAVPRGPMSRQSCQEDAIK